jgi:hypothetical protein
MLPRSRAADRIKADLLVRVVQPAVARALVETGGVVTVHHPAVATVVAAALATPALAAVTDLLQRQVRAGVEAAAADDADTDSALSGLGLGDGHVLAFGARLCGSSVRMSHFWLCRRRRTFLGRLN